MNPKKIDKKNIIIGSVALIIIGGVATIFTLIALNKRVSIDKAEVYAPKIDLSAKLGGPLNEVMVKEGDHVLENDVVARVGNELIKAKTNGIIVSINDNFGKNFGAGEKVVSMINPDELRIVAHLDEDKGLKDVRLGQKAIFTIDAFGSKKYMGTVDEISEVSRDSAVVFNISDKREVKQFDVKIRFNVGSYPEIKNGMSAKVKIYK
jgi:multidrug resistance efflux pump